MPQLTEMLSIPVLNDLIPDGLRPGTLILIEFDPDSQWVSIAITVAVRCLMEDRHVAYLAFTMSPAEVAKAMAKLGLDVAAAEKSGLLAIEDWYSASLYGGKLETGTTQRAVFERVEGRLRVQSLKVADLSVEWLKTSKTGPHIAHDIVDFWPEGSVAVSESCSPILRFSDEKSFIEFFDSRIRAEEHKRGNLLTLQGVTRGVHSDWLYKRLESACDGIIDLRVAELEGEVKNLLRIRTLRGQPHDSKWHAITVARNGEAKLESRPG